jgi:serine/threonine protein kinase
MVGRTVSHYQFLEKLGAGGMGDIYKAQDTRLNRFVAIKALSGPSAGDPERRRRFIQEAQAASGLNHPNIITIHDIISEENTQFMVMEFVAGKTMVDLIPKGGFRMQQALQYAVQMADALNTAHAAGIVHRDLKPANVMVTEAGLVKILDFGLAKLTDRGPATQLGDNTQTIADAPLTVEGSIIGTVSYMSPEQAQGRKVDTRSDIFSFGVVLYEMVTGRRAFEGETSLSTLSSILRDDVKPMAEVAPDVPSQMEQLISRCLRKKPDERWQAMSDVKMALNALKYESDSGTLYRTKMAAAQKAQRKKSPMLLYGGIAAAVVALAAIGGTVWIKHRQAAQVVAEAPAPPPAAAPVTPPPEAPPPEPAAQTPPPAPVDATLTNNSIVDLVSAKVSTSLILSQIRSSKTNFDLSTPEIIRLTKAGVPDAVIEQMRNPKRAVPSQAPGNPVVASKQTQPLPAPAPSPVPQTAAAPPTPQPAAQPAPVAVAVAPAPAPAPSAPIVQTVILKVNDGTPFKIKLAEDIPSDAEEGRALRFTTAEDFLMGGMVVVPRGASITGEITETGGKKKFLGIAGGSKLSFKLTQADAAGQKLSVRSAPSRRADGPAQRPVEAAGAKPKAKEIAAIAGTDYIAYVDGDQSVSIRK